MNSPVDKIKERLSIEEVVSAYIKLDRAGNNLKAKCPFHNEKTPSFFISPDRGTYYCFGCAASGDIFTFVEEFEGLDFKGALKLLADRAGVALEPYSREATESKSEKEKLYEVMEEATKYFENNLKESEEILEYLKSRGLNDKSIKDFRIGYALLDWRLLYDHLKSKNFTDSEIERAGLAKKPPPSASGTSPLVRGREGGGFYDRFRGRIIFPIADSSGRIVAFSGRIFVDDGKSAKYLNSPETPIFKKSSFLYGIDKAKESIRKHDFSIVVEGQFDLILSHQAGYRNTVATSGTALVGSEKTEDNIINSLGLLQRLSNNIVFVFDSDKAGVNASMRATPIALALFKDMQVKAAQVKDGKDPADLISKNGPDAWKKVISGSIHIIDFLVQSVKAMNKNKDELKIQVEIAEKVIPFINKIQNPVKRAHFLSSISKESGISENIIKDIANSRLDKDIEDNKFIEKIEKSLNRRQDYIERKLLGIAFWQKTLATPAVDFEMILNKLGEASKKYEDVKQDLIFEAEVFYQDADLMKKDTEEMFLNLEEEMLKEELSKKMRELYLAEEKKDQSLATQIFKECQALNDKLQEIKNSRIKVV